MTPSQIAALLEASGHGFGAELDALPTAAAAWHPAPGEWCANECIGHVIEAEKRGFAGRVRLLLLDGSEPRLEAWDQVEVASHRNDCERAPAELVAELAQLRRRSVDLLHELRGDQLALAGMHPKVGRLTIDEVIHEWVHHDRNHLRQLMANVQSYVWPDMGNAQLFVGE
jgi:hypothetical protein